MFEQLLDSIRETTTTVLMRVEIKQPEEAQAAAQDNLARGEARADASHPLTPTLHRDSMRRMIRAVLWIS